MRHFDRHHIIVPMTVDDEMLLNCDNVASSTMALRVQGRRCATTTSASAQAVVGGV